jgi:hypothetical protein
LERWSASGTFGWSLLVPFGWAQPLIDFVLWMHFIRPVYVIQPFSLPIAAVLIVVTFATGFILAFLFAALWNQLHRYQGLE